MASELPAWYGQQRGTDLSDYYYEAGELEEVSGNSVQVRAGLSGTAVIAMLLMAIVAGMGAGGVPVGLVVLAALASAGLVAWCLKAEWEVEHSDSPGAAATMTAGLTNAIGEIIIIAFVIAAIVAVVLFIAGLIAALSSDR